jgi:crotonobetaine/carnitine-CoA ligase
MFLDNGLEKGETFAIFMRNHPEFVSSLYAGCTIGAVACLIDPRTKGGRLKYMLTDSKARAVIVSDECLPQLEEVIEDLPHIKFVRVVNRPEHDLPISDKYPSLNETLEQETWKTVPQQIMDVRHPFQIIYTSGTTGDPKGVMLRNNRFGLFNLVTRLVWKYKKDDVLYTGLSLTHGNAHAVTLVPALATETKAVFSARFTRTRIWDIARKYGCTSFSLLGGMAAGIFNMPERPDDKDNPVHTIISAGTPKAIWEEMEERFGIQVLEWYAAVEGGFAYKAPGVGPVGSFGKPLPGVLEFRVVDEEDNEMPAGESGELIIRMIRGETRVDYLGKVAASEEKCRGGWLRTGDIVHKDTKGYYFFDHRKGSELRRAGDFIQPDHVEKIIGELSEVSEVCVYGIASELGAPGESDLVAAISPFNGAALEPSAIFDKCKKDLEPNFIPSFLQLVDEVPKTISEKFISRVLKADFSKDSDNVHSFTDFKG